MTALHATTNQVPLFCVAESPRVRGMGGHQSSRSETDVWLTPRRILDDLGPFDLDPCAAPEPRPWPTAATHITLPADGLRMQWTGRIWLNPPYSTIGPWMRRLAQHQGGGIALVFARTETRWFSESVWGCATAARFLLGRLHFCRPDGTESADNAGAPSVLIAYGQDNAERLKHSSLLGAFVQIASLSVAGGGQ